MDCFALLCGLIFYVTGGYLLYENTLLIWNLTPFGKRQLEILAIEVLVAITICVISGIYALV